MTRNVHLSDVKPRPRSLVNWERYRHTRLALFIECFCEFVSGLVLTQSCVFSPFPDVQLGVFLYTWCGTSAKITFAVAVG